jgi:hypothetical protein
MTRKDYIAIAEAMRYGLGSLQADTSVSITRCEAVIAQEHFAAHLAEAMHADNPRFDREHFLAVVRGERNLKSRPPRSR